MSDEKKLIRRVIEYTDDGEHFTEYWMFWCPGCGNAHEARTISHDGKGPIWTFDGNVDCPTIEPSLRISETRGDPYCHVVVTKGMLNFCVDCGHHLAGKVIPMEAF